MAKYPMTEVIAERSLEFHDKNGAGSTITIYIGKPAKDAQSNHGDWYCPYIISGFAKERSHHMCGVDSLQALNLTLKTVAAELKRLSKGGKLKWLGMDDLGLSQTIS